MKKKKGKLLNVFLILSIFILIVSISFVFYYHYKNINLNKELKSTDNVLKKLQTDKQDLVNKKDELDNKIKETKENKKDELEELEVWKKMKEKLS